MVQIVLEGGRSDLERHHRDVEQPPTNWLPRGDRYEPAADHWDQRVRDINGCWRYRLRVEHLAIPRGF